MRASYPGWAPGTFGFHADTGFVHLENGLGITSTEPWTFGDVPGVGVDYANSHVFFTLNGNLVSSWAIPERWLTRFFPTFTCGGHGEKFYVNFGKKPFKFDLLEYIKTEANGKLPMAYSSTIDSINKASKLIPYTKREIQSSELLCGLFYQEPNENLILYQSIVKLEETFKSRNAIDDSKSYKIHGLRLLASFISDCIGARVQNFDGSTLEQITSFIEAGLGLVKESFSNFIATAISTQLIVGNPNDPSFARTEKELVNIYIFFAGFHLLQYHGTTRYLTSIIDRIQRVCGNCIAKINDDPNCIPSFVACSVLSDMDVLHVLPNYKSSEGLQLPQKFEGSEELLKKLLIDHEEELSPLRDETKTTDDPVMLGALALFVVLRYRCGELILVNSLEELRKTAVDTLSNLSLLQL
mmetsp:Transcript_7869/g.8667  ORF Transcript_7869/g.8667 Transcript_7869/m.8667 type:complete len:412 (+) Transcript_7869:562-1797(+)